MFAYQHSTKKDDKYILMCAGKQMTQKNNLIIYEPNI